MRNRATMLLAMLLCLPGIAFAQWTVIDPTNLVQNITQVQKSIQQVQTLQNQLKTAEAQYKAISGSRGMSLIKTDTTRDYIPTTWQQTLEMAGQGSAYAQRLKQIRDLAGAIGATELGKLPENVRKQADRSANREVASQAVASQVYDRANARFDEIGRLGARIETAQDQKAIMDLQARIQIESVNLQNELIRLMAQAQASQADRNLDQERTNNEHRRALQSF